MPARQAGSVCSSCLRTLTNVAHLSRGFTPSLRYSKSASVWASQCNTTEVRYSHSNKSKTHHASSRSLPGSPRFDDGHNLAIGAGSNSRLTNACTRWNIQSPLLPKRLRVRGDTLGTQISKPCSIALYSTSQSGPKVQSPRNLPPDGSSQLSEHAKTLPTTSVRRLLASYLALSKPRLTFLTVLTTASAYSLYPVPSVLSAAATESPSLSALTLVYLTVGTGLCSASANSLNMMMEPEHDAKMSRTRNRPIVRGLIGRRGALVFAAVTGLVGVAGLYLGVNPTVSFLGGLNIFLYAGVYTPLKRMSVINTWIGAVVGAIPPLMGWAAGAGQTATGSGDWKELLLGDDAAGGWLLATLLFSWQFHHFNALSWTVRHEYRMAGYRMLAWVNEAMNARVALRYALLCFPACWGLSFVGVTDTSYLLTSTVINMWIARAAWRFYKLGGKKGSARGLFWAGVWQLPVLMVLAMAQKKGLAAGLWNRVAGEKDMTDEASEWEEEEEEEEEEESRH